MMFNAAKINPIRGVDDKNPTRIIKVDFYFEKFGHIFLHHRRRWVGIKYPIVGDWKNGGYTLNR